MKKIYYEKVGRRYKPVYEYDQTLMDAFPKGTKMILVYLLIGSVLLFGSGERYAQYRQTKDRRTLWMCIAGVCGNWCA